ncbi:MAG: ATPase, T2SS/T4P/T4SS family [Planctomycetota bacterium]
MAQDGSASASSVGTFYINPVWLALIIVAAAGWLYEVSWIHLEAMGIGMHASRWVSAFLGGGILLMALSFFAHPLFSIIMIFAEMGGFFYFLTLRNDRVPTQYEILGRWLGGTDTLQEGPATGGTDQDLPHVNVSVTNEGGKTLEEYIRARPDFADAAQVLGDLLAQASKHNAESLRLAPGTESFGVFYELGGVFQRVDSIPPETGQQIISGMAQFLGLKRQGQPRVNATVSLPEEGDLPVQIQGVKNSQGPAISVSLPDWHKDVYRGGLEGLGMGETMIEQLHAVIDSPGNTVLFSGPPSSGRTSTYHAAIGHIDIFTTEVTTLETDPIHELDQITRHEVDVGSREEMEGILPSIFRQGADVIGVDEVTQPDVINPLLEFACDGGRLVGTIKAGSASQALIQFSKTADTEMTAKTLSAITCQRLIRTLCENCKEPLEPNPKLLKKLKIKPGEVGTWFEAVGCEQCLQTGYRGQTGIFEFLPVNKKVRTLIARGKADKNSSIKQAASDDNLISMYRDALTKVQQGKTTLKEIRRVLQ